MDDIVIIDSYSTDATQQLSTNGARVFKNKFSDFAQQRNFANDTAAFKTRWSSFRCR
jgi:hypothetical protein